MSINFGFWEKINKPIAGLAPMYDVTDSAWRRILTMCAKPDVMFTEFVSVDGLLSAGAAAQEKLLVFDQVEQPLVVQFFGNNPEKFYQAAQMAQKRGFAGIDINMGCPDKKVIKQGAGSALIQTPELAQKIIQRTKEGAGHLPVSVKTRMGTGKLIVNSWISCLLEAEPAVITLHGRTKNQGYSGVADWDYIKQAVDLRNGMQSSTLILGNGDIKNLLQGYFRTHESGADGFLAGRATLGNPWFFDKKPRQISFVEKMDVLIEHAKLYDEIYQGKYEKSFIGMKKHFSAYLKSYLGIKDVKMRLMECQNYEEASEVIKKFV